MFQTMPEDVRHRLPPSSSDLEALDSHVPSSSFTSISFALDGQISPSCTSGDIPILFHLSSQDSLASVSQASRRLSTASTFRLSSSVQTVETVGTFGPCPRQNILADHREHRNSSFSARYGQAASLLGLEEDLDQSFGDASFTSDNTNPSPSPLSDFNLPTTQRLTSQ